MCFDIMQQTAIPEKKATTDVKRPPEKLKSYQFQRVVDIFLKPVRTIGTSFMLACGRDDHHHSKALVEVCNSGCP